MKEKDIVKFKNPLDKDEEASVMVVIEIRGNHALVSDLRFSEWAVPPTDVYQINDLEAIEKSNELTVRS